MQWAKSPGDNAGGGSECDAELAAFELGDEEDLGARSDGGSLETMVVVRVSADHFVRPLQRRLIDERRCLRTARPQFPVAPSHCAIPPAVRNVLRSRYRQA